MKKILLPLLFLMGCAATYAANPTDVLTAASWGNTSPSDKAYTSPETGVTYTASYYCYKKDPNIGLTDEEGPEAIVVSASDSKLVSLSFEWFNQSYTSSVLIYGSNVPYTTPSAFMSSADKGDLIATLKYPDTKVPVTGDYKYVAMTVVPAGGEAYAAFKSIAFEWAAALEPIEPLVFKDGVGAVLKQGTDVNRIYGDTRVEVSSATAGLTYKATFNGEPVSLTGNSFVVTQSGTLEIEASAEGYINRTATAQFELFEPLTSIQAVWNAYPLPGNGTVVDPEPFTVLFDATVVYVANVPEMFSDEPDGQVYITDGTNFSRIFFEGKTVNLRPGDVIAKGWTARFGRMNGWKQFLPEGVMIVSSHDGEVPAPVAIGDEAALQALDPGTPVVVKGVTLPVATSPDVYIGDEAVKQIQTDNSPVALINAFGLPSVEAGRYDVYGLVDFYGYKRSNAPAVGPTDGDYSHRRWRVAVTEFEVWKPTSPRPVFALANDSEVDSGEPIVITCQDEAATIMYSMDGENYSEYDAANPPVMPAEDVTVSAYSRQEGYHDSAVRRVSLRYSGKAGIADITLDPAGAAEYYDLTGRRVDSPKAGMYIRVQGGRATKVIL